MFWDIDFLVPINHNRSPFFDVLFSIISFTVALVAILIPLIIFFQGVKRKSMRKIVDAVFILVSLGLSALISGIIKYQVGRPRPFELYFEIEKMASGGTPSFPSGHAADAFSFATALSIVYPKWFIIVPAYWWAFMVAYSRMYLGVHYFTDVLAGLLIGVYATIFVCFVLSWLGLNRRTLFYRVWNN